MKIEKGRDLQEYILCEQDNYIAIKPYPMFKGVWEIRNILPATYTAEFEKKTGKTSIKIPFIGGGHLKLGRTNDKEAAISADIRYCTARGDSDMREDEFIITEGNMNQSPYAFWIFYDNPTETERMKYLSRLDPERDIDWEKIKPESTQYKIAKALCKYKEIETFPKKYFYTK